ncbi:uncharacterized protein DS421_19g665190 [Arachis hypogaea]|uniref:Uncharacterized protein n=1 Tax=Arachis hypogaea TaxID=3818 RepID=A0A6B9VAL2_ARAHY|nr:uncharacterized protein DS421_19g665190 [Arachis hypogaea]
MQSPSRRRSSTCPATTVIASALSWCAQRQLHPNACVLSPVRASTQPPFPRCCSLSSAAVHPSIQPSPSSMKASSPSPSSLIFRTFEKT